MKKLLLTAALAVIVPLTASAQDIKPIADMPAGHYTLDKTHASLNWQVMHMGLAKYTARFTDFDADIQLDPADPTKSTLSVTVNPASIQTNYPYPEKNDFDKELSENANWFNVGEYPEIKFVSTALTVTDEHHGTVTGDLTFMGVTKPMTLDVTFNGGLEKKPYAEVAALGFSATGTLKRSEWGFDTYLPMIGDDVNLIIETEFHKASK